MSTLHIYVARTIFNHSPCGYWKHVCRVTCMMWSEVCYPTRWYGWFHMHFVRYISTVFWRRISLMLRVNSRGTTTVQGSQQCIQRCQEHPINLCIIFGQYILFDQAELYGLFVLFQICSDHHLNLIYIYYCCFWLFELCYVIMSIICVHCIYMCLHIIVHVYLYNYDIMFIDKLQIV